ncbi:SDR family NAD(P)-dependent oxidoreductase [Roseibium salinum]|uniref:SDR family NAD(P)-dependent oxidoreductase n=1 Tax=Roseibium salinum TaxID=1604349 RepID=UPI00361C350E
MSDLSGKTALVTGSVQGIGLAVARSLAGAGARIAVHGLATADEAEAAVAAMREAGAPEARFFDADMRDVAAIEAMMATVADWGAADILVNNAGIQKTASLAEADAATWDAIISVNLSGVFHTMRLALPAMAERGYGRVINIASVHGLVASVNKAPYVASKFGVVGMSKVAALEYAAAGSKGLRRRHGQLHRAGLDGNGAYRAPGRGACSRVRRRPGQGHRRPPGRNSPPAAPPTPRKSANWPCGCATLRRIT